MKKALINSAAPTVETNKGISVSTKANYGSLKRKGTYFMVASLLIVAMSAHMFNTVAVAANNSPTEESIYIESLQQAQYLTNRGWFCDRTSENNSKIVCTYYKPVPTGAMDRSLERVDRRFSGR